VVRQGHHHVEVTVHHQGRVPVPAPAQVPVQMKKVLIDYLV